MNSLLQDFARKKIKEGLSKLTVEHRAFFKRLYSYSTKDLPMDVIIDDIPEEKLSRALDQVQNTLKKEGIKWKK